MKKYKRKQNTPEYRKKYTGIYGSWYALKQRCNNPNNISYKNYGARGITFPEKWATFSGFYEDMKDNYNKGLTIDRIDNNKSYSKDNCRWLSRKQQNNNKRSNIVITFKNRTLPLALWAEKIGMSFDVIRSRWYRGFPIEKILSTTKFHRYGTQK